MEYSGDYNPRDACLWERGEYKAADGGQHGGRAAEEWQKQPRAVPPVGRGPNTRGSVGRAPGASSPAARHPLRQPISAQLAQASGSDQRP